MKIGLHSAFREPAPVSVGLLRAPLLEKTSPEKSQWAVLAGDIVRFGRLKDHFAPSRTFEAMGPSGWPLQLRQWHLPNQPFETLPEKGPVILMVPGLGGKTEWGGAFVRRLMRKDDLDEAGNPLVYGLDTSVLGKDPKKKGELNSRKDLVLELKDAADYLRQKHGGPVIVAAISLGALTATHLAADYPESVDGLILMSPAYRTAKQSFNVGFFARAALQHVAERFGISTPTPLRMPYEDDAVLAEEYAWMKEAAQQVSSLSTHSFVELGKMMFWEAFPKASRVNKPVLMMVPGQDSICDKEAMKQGFDLMPSTEKTYVEYSQARHNLLFENIMKPASMIVKMWLWAQKQLISHRPSS